jgi:hypothetical protein
MFNFIADNMAAIVVLGGLALATGLYFVWSAADEREEHKRNDLRLVHFTVDHDDRANNRIMGEKMIGASMNALFGITEVLVKAAVSKPTQSNQ